MVEGGESLRFAIEPGQPFRIAGDKRRQDFDGDVAVEPRVARAVDGPHAAFAEFGNDFEGADTLADHARGLMSAQIRTDSIAPRNQCLNGAENALTHVAGRQQKIA